jgi:hypothetical protein
MLMDLATLFNNLIFESVSDSSFDKRKPWNAEVANYSCKCTWGVKLTVFARSYGDYSLIPNVLFGYKTFMHQYY